VASRIVVKEGEVFFENTQAQGKLRRGEKLSR